MNNPKNLVLGLTDSVSVPLAGALLSFNFQEGIGPIRLGKRSRQFAGAEAWTVFGLAIYTTSHFVFLLGSWLDKPRFGLRRYTQDWQIWLVAPVESRERLQSAEQRRVRR